MTQPASPSSSGYPPGSRKAAAGGPLEAAAQEKADAITVETSKGVDVLVGANVISAKVGTLIKAVTAAAVSVVVLVIGMYELAVRPADACPAVVVPIELPTTAVTVDSTSPALTILPAS